MATVVDANSSLFPLAYAVVDAENDDIGSGSFKTFIELSEFMHLSFLNQQHLHYSPTVKWVSWLVLEPPSWIVHMAIALEEEFKNVELKSLLWKAAQAITVEKFNKALNDMWAINPCSVDWLLGHAVPEHWAEL